MPSCRASVPTRVAAHCLPPSGGFDAGRCGRAVRRARRVTVSAREWSRTGCPRRARRRSASDRRGAAPSFGPPSAPDPWARPVACVPLPAAQREHRPRRYNVRSPPGGSAFRRQCCSFPDRPRRLARPPSTRGWFAGSALGFDAHFDRTRGGRRPSPSSPISRDTRKTRPSRVPRRRPPERPSLTPRSQWPGVRCVAATGARLGDALRPSPLTVLPG
ncbi:hypothetical protein IHE45_20G017300 [Dioscorea alata]|uniref:Uncharacterized protein n=1 Tax=Dioscorea alata TaxID=55571 RepID=A0ACB7TUQ4_DIOAL|nr:hypothetical protein IHE45_20G017300 [Dioscorea alata]